ncbi:MAG: type IX secretion system membrane protein PorP/SprF [Bacteroidia bacterium]|nr:type IX secretion system membrane protein PorP/SprF [Bacteroidia bacterium]NND24383.1 type IX secretion system membrane protein PorP/SprF [Flavobacteriaceae bacterium]MBT8279793.1 type IX secretion system membrane protein PorP/SprF [Bacteroidia bacterium]NNK59864.1 type IX secretion system membrane protein PorP/SprF [Flavobacteriaceae bacterium]NNL31761.1 type IX secretion system membrane protein PorP/SprF [Flavobacteriaceae bacterium]
MNLKTFCLLAIATVFLQFSNAQEGLPIYSDYLTDNYYLIHPSMAGVANCGKIRLTARKQWFGQDDAPSLQTLSINSRLGESPSAIGAIVYNDENGFHSQVGAYLTYAHHIMFSRNPVDLNMLSFGLSAGMIQYKLDETSFLAEGFDPIIAGIEQSATNFNIDFGFSYSFIDFYAHATVKNILKNEGINFNEQGLSYDNLRTYLFTLGNVFESNNSTFTYEPSIMYMYRDATKESSIDINAKVYKEMDFGTLWGGLSYRRSFDGAEFLDGSGVSSQKLQYFTPFVGVNYNDFVFAYTYSYQANSVVFNNGGFHQLTLGYNFNCRKEKYDCNCPYVN